MIKKTLILISVLCFCLFAQESTNQRYVVKIKIKQEHFTLDPFVHMKDNANAIYLELPADKQFYSEVSVGTVLSDQFRTGSFILNGSIGNWKITICEKRTE